MSTDKLFLDGLFPPPPAQLLRDLEAVGADGCFAYVRRPGGVGSWTPDHVAVLRQSGKLCVPIVVPEPAGDAVADVLASLRAFGFLAGLYSFDLEPPNLPPQGWEEAADAALAAQEYQGLDYGNQGDLVVYSPDDEHWLARWLRTGVLEPLPTRPPGLSAWQFVNDVQINGSQYDASVLDGSLFPPPAGLEEAAMIFVYPNGLQVLVVGPLVIELPDPFDATALTAQGVRSIVLDQAGADSVEAARARASSRLQGQLALTLSGSGSLTAS